MLNLVGNALKHTFAGSITVALQVRRSHAELTVTDTGVGVPKADLPHLFTRDRGLWLRASPRPWPTRSSSTPAWPRG